MQESVFYYITVTNQNYPMPPMPQERGIKEGILKGLYKFLSTEKPDAPLRAQLFGSGAIMNEVLEARKILAESFDVEADVWSVTSYKALQNDGMEVDRWNMLHPTEPPRVPHVSTCLAGAEGVLVVASDYMKVLGNAIARWFPRPPVVLGTDGFGRSDGRRALRDFFEVDARHIVFATLSALFKEGKISPEVVQRAIEELEINPDKANPVTS
jgi:pyruvate dehydrogenase E1 component